MARTARPVPKNSSAPAAGVAAESESPAPQLIERSPDGVNGWDGLQWRPIADFGDVAGSITESNAEEPPMDSLGNPAAPGVVTDVAPESIPANEEPPKRGRGRPRKVMETAVSAPVVELDPDAPFRPNVTRLAATAKRVVSTGHYESFEITATIEAEPDPRHTSVVNLANLRALVEQEVTECAERVARDVQLGKA